ncbi:protein of unknown function [Methylocaldum szegediense]|uniref:Uncharacterized protein n=1 Tax=Methylocaldum szegediense TaxID=73780 RepID=A0ABN8X1H6_9GAMM|nr:protein of unknown function [Methylocaldum szegediense]
MTVQFIVLVDEKVGEFYLTDRGLLCVSKGRERVLSPQDKVNLGPCGVVSAADIVATWLRQSNRTPEAQQAAEKFLNTAAL